MFLKHLPQQSGSRKGLPVDSEDYEEADRNVLLHGRLLATKDSVAARSIAREVTEREPLAQPNGAQKTLYPDTRPANARPP